MIRHRFVSTRPDGADDTVLRPSDWNNTHLSSSWVVPLVNASVTWTNMPAAATELAGNYRTRYDLTNSDDVRLIVCTGVAGATNATLRVQYSTDQSAWSDLTPQVNIATPAGVKESAWTAVAAGAKGDVFLRVLGVSGDGVIDPQFRLIHLQVR